MYRIAFMLMTRAMMENVEMSSPQEPFGRTALILLTLRTLIAQQSI